MAIDDRPAPGRSLRFDAVSIRDAVVETVVSGRQRGEGPVWDRQDGPLLFSDLPANGVLRWKPGQGVRVDVAAAVTACFGRTV